MKTKNIQEAKQIVDNLRTEYAELDKEFQQFSFLSEQGQITDEQRKRYHKVAERLGEIDVCELLIAEMELQRQILLREAESWQEAGEVIHNSTVNCELKKESCLQAAKNLEKRISELVSI